MRVVGVGASAGGLEAMGAFFRGVPPDSGLAFVVVQHLDPTHKGFLPELLERATPMSVVQVRNKTRIRPDAVYVIPPNKDMSVLHGVLHLFPPAAARGLRLPIDFFFRSLAVDAGEAAVGVVLSGMGSDGTVGLRAIKESGGLTLVQDPATAKFEAMPRGAIEAGLAEIVAPPEELARRMLAFLLHASHVPRPEPEDEPAFGSALDKVVILLRAQTGHDFSFYKKSVLYRRVERRMGIHQIGSLARYVRFLQDNIQERELLFKELLIGVTRFFRDPEAWRRLQTLALPGLLSGKPPGHVLRAWVPGCSTGEEAYSLAILLREAAGRGRRAESVQSQIFATDLDRDGIEKARAGVYPAGIAADLTPDRLRRHFVKDDRGFRAGKEIRESIVFAVQNMVMDPPFTKLDILVCRNLLIYLAPELQKKLLPLFHFSLNPGGLLFLGTSESIAGFSDLFETVDAKQKIFRRREAPRRAAEVSFPSSFHAPGPDIRRRSEAGAAPVSLQGAAEKMLLGQFAPAAVLTNDRGDILFFSGRTGAFLEPAAGKADLNVFAMARDGLRFELADAFRAAVRGGGEAVRPGLKVPGETGLRTVDLVVRPMQDPEALRGTFLVVFVEPETPGGAAPSARRASVREGRAEWKRYREHLESLRQEMQTSQEELKSANEELQSTNEELQSTNEELTTSKEELQSMNEELQTVNAELQARIEELSCSQSDMKNLLNATDIATIFLDGRLRVRRFTDRAAPLFKLIGGDVGRPVTDLATDLVYPGLAADVGGVLASLVPMERPIETRDGRWFLVRVMPYRTQNNVIDGVVMTFADITASKALEAELRRARSEKDDARGR